MNRINEIEKKLAELYNPNKSQKINQIINYIIDSNYTFEQRMNNSYKEFLKFPEIKKIHLFLSDDKILDLFFNSYKSVIHNTAQDLFYFLNEKDLLYNYFIKNIKNGKIELKKIILLYPIMVNKFFNPKSTKKEVKQITERLYKDLGNDSKRFSRNIIQTTLYKKEKNKSLTNCIKQK